jgi:hypothetical protein
VSKPTRFCPMSAAQKRRLADLIRFRGGLPRLKGKFPRSTQWLAREVCWQAARYTELLAWYPSMAELVHAGIVPIEDAVILMRLMLELYDDEGFVLAVADQWYRDPQAPLRYLGSDMRPTEFPPAVHQEVDQILARLQSEPRLPQTRS